MAGGIPCPNERMVIIMAFCPVCGAQVQDGVPNCPNCGAAFAQAPVNYDPKDHTAEFDPKDVSDNKVFAMAAYLMGIAGIIITLLAAQKSDYAMFHARQSLKISVCEILLLICSLLLVWTVIVPLAGLIASIVILVVRVILFFQVCKGQAKDAPIIGNFGFLK